MSRFARVVAVDQPHHVVHRGNQRQILFRSDPHRLRYLDLLRRECDRHRLEIWSYCLMPNHVHAIVVPREPTSLARAIGRAHCAFAQWINRTTARTGHLWENRYFSCPLDESHLWAAVRYVERNPLRAGLVDSSVDYPWSSARCHGLGRADSLLAPSRPFTPASAGWAEWLDCLLEEPAIEELRRRTRTGRPLGSESFVRDLEDRLNRTLDTARRGRKLREPRPGESTEHSCAPADVGLS